MSEYLKINWRSEWIRYNKARKAPDSADFWSGRAKDFSQYAQTSSYAKTFIEHLALAPESSVFDMGAGSGTLALPLASAGHRVVAADFSPGMLAELNRSAEHLGLTNIQTVLVDFNAPWEAWSAAGIKEKSVEVALASRSTMVEDLGAAFDKLERVAQSKVAVTLATEYGPRGTKLCGEPLEGARDEEVFIPDYVFAMNLLFQEGRFPTLHFIDANKKDRSGALQKVRWAYVSWQVS